METLLIKTENGPVLINRVDFDAETMTLATADDVQPLPSETQAEIIPPVEQVVNPANLTKTEQLLVTKDGKKFVVVNSDQVRIERDGIDKDGYKTEADAWAAIMALPPVTNA